MAILAPVLEFENVSKFFYRHGGQMLLRDRLAHALRPGTRERFYALTDVSFKLDHGESMAVVGSNGAGKSTLLNIATSLCDPSDGRVAVGGRVEALLELGSGFHPDLTGAENLRIKASLLGLTRRQVRERFDQIVEFSELADFIDEPLRTYSAGMSDASGLRGGDQRGSGSVDHRRGPGGRGPELLSTSAWTRLWNSAMPENPSCACRMLSNTLESMCDRGLWLDHGRVVKQGSVGGSAQGLPRFGIGACRAYGPDGLKRDRSTCELS